MENLTAGIFGSLTILSITQPEVVFFLMGTVACFGIVVFLWNEYVINR